MGVQPVHAGGLYTPNCMEESLHVHMAHAPAPRAPHTVSTKNMHGGEPKEGAHMHDKARLACLDWSDPPHFVIQHAVLD